MFAWVCRVPDCQQCNLAPTLAARAGGCVGRWVGWVGLPMVWKSWRECAGATTCAGTAAATRAKGQHAAREMQHAACSATDATCNMNHATSPLCDVRNATYNTGNTQRTSHATRNELREACSNNITCNLLHVRCNLKNATCNNNINNMRLETCGI
jgi:hypothetical protein